MAYPYYREPPPKGLDPAGNLDFLYLTQRPKPTDLIAPTGRGGFCSSQYAMSNPPVGKFDPTYSWNDVIKLINLRTHSPGTWKLRLMDEASDVTLDLKSTDPFNGFFGTDAQRGPKLKEVTDKKHRWTRQDVIAARNALRSINGDIRFMRLPKVWTFKVIRDLLEPRWQEVKVTFTNTDPIPKPDFIPSASGQFISEAYAFAFGNSFTIDFKDGYGPRFVSSGPPGTKVKPEDLMKRYATEDTFDGQKVLDHPGKVLASSQFDESQVPDNMTLNYEYKQLHRTFDSNPKGTGSKLVTDLTGTWKGVGKLVEIEFDPGGEDLPAPS